MNYLFELSKEHKTIPTSEVLSCLEAEKKYFEIADSNPNILIINTRHNKMINNVAERLSHSYYINEFLFSCKISIDKIKNSAKTKQIKQKGSIAIKYRNRSKKNNSQPILKALAEIYTKDRKVILDKPDIEIRVIITDSNIYVGKKLFEINRTQFEERKVQNRPFFSPISLHPKIARSIVNLSTIKKGQVLIDPFCGTGGIILEAGLIGVNVIGSDIEKKMIDGCRITLNHYKIENYKLFNSDIGDIHKHIKPVDAVVTDLPYGKSTTTKGEEKNQLYQRAFENISNILKNNCKAVIGISNIELLTIGEKYMTLIEVHDIRVHRSLTRYFVVYQK